MSSLKTHDGIAVYGYIRENFDKTCWIHEIVYIIIQYFQNNSGSLYMFGTGGPNLSYGMRENDKKQCRVPTLLKPFNQNNALYVSTSYHTLIVDTDGDLWTCSNGKKWVSDGKPWNPSRLWKLHTPTKLCLDYKAVSVSTGGKHSLILLENGWVQSFGMDNHFQLGHRTTGMEQAPDMIVLMYKLGKLGPKKPILVPKTIETLKKYKIVQICAGSLHSAVLTEGGDLFCFGCNKDGQCGVARRGRVRAVAVPTRVEMNSRVSSVACGYSRTVLIDQNHLIYSCGVVGDASSKRNRTPTLIEVLKDKRMKVCAAGRNHSICVDEEGIAWTFGSNKFGQCGIASDDMVFPPSKIEYFASNNIKAIECAAGGHQSCVVSEDESLYVFGNNEDYQLGLKEKRSYFMPQKFPLQPNVHMKQISMGNHFTAMICK